MSEFLRIRHALEIARQNGFAEVELEVDGIEFSAKLEPKKPAQQTSPLLDIDGPTCPVEQLVDIGAPCVGYFASNGEPIEKGAFVVASQIVAVITALGLANEVESKVAGEVTDVLVRNGDPVEFGQPLYRIKVNS